MIEETGIITHVDDQHIWVETQIKTTCGGCVANDHCGTGTIARALSPRAQLLSFPRQDEAQVGQQVKLGIPEQSLLGASALMYLLPLLVLMVSALAADTLLPAVDLVSELWVVVVSLTCTGLSFRWLKQRLANSQRTSRFQPQLLRLLPRAQESVPIQQLEP